MIRKYQPADLDDYMTTWESASAVAHPFLTDAFQAKTRSDIINVFLPITENWVWDADGRVVGFVSMMGNEIGGLFVRPERQRQGIGRALVDHVREKHEHLEVEVFLDNVIGRAFYAKYGFLQTEAKLHEETGLELIRLLLPLDESDVDEPQSV